MIDALLRTLVKLLISLHYRVRIVGLNRIARRPARGILFLANHPALIDPVILMAWLHHRFAPRALADKDQIDRPFIRWLARRVGVRAIPDVVKYGAAARGEVRDALKRCADGLRRGENLLLYPSGRVYRRRVEDVGASRSAHRLLELAPRARVVLIRTTGLWGSAFSWAAGYAPDVPGALRKAVWRLLANGVFLSPRRQVTIELREGRELPRSAGRAAINRFLESFYNRRAPPNTYVPYTIWEPGGRRVMPEPAPLRAGGDLLRVAQETKEQVLKFLAELTGGREPAHEDRLARDLGLDSMALAELAAWIEGRFAVAQVDVESLRTVSDVMLAAGGQGGGLLAAALKPIPAKWFHEKTPPTHIEMPPGRTVTQVFLHQARKAPGKLILADQIGGALSYRRVITAVMILKRRIEKLPGDHVGIMLPASAAATVVYLAALFAGKTPVMVNWTVGQRNIRQLLDMVGVSCVLTAERLVSRLESQATDFGALKERLLPLERLRGEISIAGKLRALAAARVRWAELDRAAVPDTAAVLFTSGSEAAPKCVPLTHANLLANLRDIASVLTIWSNDRLVGFLPPFHSFGLTVTMLAPLCLCLPVVYHANPTEPAVLARLIEAYKPTVVAGTPTFMGGIARAAAEGQLDSVRLAVTGAEKCPEGVYDALAERCPNAVVAEGYGVTECSPIISINDDRAPRRGTIGKILPSLRHVIVDEDARRKVAPGRTGVLLVRGPSVFGGYVNPDAQSPFVQFEGESWYRTGDLVSEEADGVLTFRGRLKRFVKVAGEMISLPQIESILMERYQPAGGDVPVLAVEAAAAEQRPQVVLFTTLALDRETVNRHLRDQGLSAIYSVHRVVRVDEIPLLGTGKTDYRRLRESLA